MDWDDLELERLFASDNLNGFGYRLDDLARDAGPSSEDAVFRCLVNQGGYGQDLGRIDDYFTLKRLQAQHSAKYNTWFETFECKVRRLDQLDFSESLGAVFKILDRILEIILAKVAPTDRVRIRLNSSVLHNPIWTPAIPKSQLTTERLMLEVDRVLQSYQEFRLDQSFEIWLQHVINPGGRCYRKPERSLLRKQLDKSSCVIQVRNADELCMARAICIGKAIADGDQILARRLYHVHCKAGTRSTDSSLQTLKTLQLLRKAGLPVRRYTIQDLPDFEAVLPEYMFVVVGVHQLNSIVYSGQLKEKKIILLQHDDHFDVLKSLSAWYRRSYWCFACQKGFDEKHAHRCPAACKQCFDRVCDQQGPKLTCPACRRTFSGQQCFAAHKKLGKDGKSVCEKFFICGSCFRFVSLPGRNILNRVHACGESYCRTCKLRVVQPGHHCYIEPEAVSAKTLLQHSAAKFLYFDFETYKCPTTGRLIPNLAVIEDDAGHSTVFPQDTSTIGSRNVTEELCNFIFAPHHKGCFVIAHNLRSFDGYFILNYLLKNGIVPDVTFKGSQLIRMDVKQYGIRFRDSLNYMPMSLAAWAKAFDVAMHKGRFPHESNCEANWGQIITFPKRTAYGYENLLKKDRKAFMKFYRKDRRKKKNLFDFNDEFIKYCKLDVTVLRLCCQQLRHLFSTITDGLCPFTSALTVAGLCSYFWRAKCLKDKLICLVPPQGFHPAKRHSKKCHQWLSCEEVEQNIKIEREVKFGRFYLDGLCQETNTAYEFFECFWHGCLQHNNPNTLHPLSGIKMRQLYEQTETRVAELQRLGFTVVTKWEHEFDERREEDSEYSALTEQFQLGERLKPRDAFYGGRTNAAKLYHKIATLEKIRYLDFISLYPSVNKYKRYPTGPVMIITKNFGPMSNYFGLAKVTVLPPEQLYLPVLPYRTNGKLTFPLCRTCVEERLAENCTHGDDDERSLTGTWCTNELMVALGKGYIVTEIFEMWHYTQSQEHLFQQYIDTFLKLKAEASGYPESAKTDAEKTRYVDDFFAKEGVRLDHGNITKNPGVRAFAKLCLNSFWGRLGMQDLRQCTTFIKKASELYDYLLSGQYTVHGLDLYTEDVMQISYSTNHEYLETNTKTNVVLAAFTTAWARLRLYEAMEPLGRRLLYYDTDSVLYIDGPGCPRLPEGTCLGDLTSELPDGEWITELVSLAPKCYAYITNKGKNVVKVKGFTINGQSRKTLNFETLLRLLLNPTDFESVDLPFRIKKDKKALELSITSITKRLRFVYDKRRLLWPSLETLPFGYKIQ